METHTDTAVAEAEAEAPAPEVTPTPESSLPDATPEPALSFTDAIDKALNPDATPEPEAAPEPTPEPEKTAEEPVTTEQEPVTTEQEPVTTKEEPAAEEDPIEALSADVGDDWTPKAANRFKQLKNELKSNRSEVEELRQTMKEQEAKMKEMSGLVEGQDFDTLKSKLAEFEQDKLVNDLEATSAYKEAVAEPLNAILERANAIASKYDIEGDSLIDAIAEEDADKQDSLLSDLLYSASDRDKASIYRIVEDLNPILERRTELYANADAALKEAQSLEEQRQNEDVAKQAELRTNVTRNVVQRVNEKLPFLSGFDGLDMGGIEQKAAGLDPSVVHPVDFAYNSVAAQLLPTIIREYLGARKEAETLTDKLAEYEGAEPTVSGAAATDGGSSIPTEKSFVDAIDSILGSA